MFFSPPCSLSAASADGVRPVVAGPEILGERALRLLLKAIDLRPKDAQIAKRLFLLARNLDDARGMATALEHEAQSDISPATISMDGIREGDSDRPLFDLRTLPLPIIHKDFQFSARQVMASRQGGSPLDVTSAELAGRRVAEEVEKLTLGESDSYTFGGGSVYGFKNFPSRLTKTLTAPTTSNQATTVQEVLSRRIQIRSELREGCHLTVLCQLQLQRPISH